jgi:Tfp pilus assembly protein FimV
MRLKNENFRNMEINLRSGAKARTDHEGCMEVDNETDQQIMIAAGWQAMAARSPRALPGIATDTPGDKNAKLWPGGPTRKQIEELRDFASETNDALSDAKREIETKDAEIEALKAEVAALKAAQPAPSTETGAAPSTSAEGASEGSSAPARKPKAPKPEADKG